jgi:hypothetical protein
MPPKKLNKTTSQQEITTDELQKIAKNTDSPQSKLKEAASAAENALAAQKAAGGLRSAAAVIKDPTKRQQYLQDAYNKEIEANGNSKKARFLTSGTFQGSVGGAGIGAAVGAGLGTVVGTVVGTVATIPTTAVGGLVGAGTGLAHGPWIKLNKIGKEGRMGDGKENVEKGPEMPEVDPDDDDVIPNPEVLRQAADKLSGMDGGGGGAGTQEGKKDKKKPRKLEVRNK